MAGVVDGEELSATQFVLRPKPDSAAPVDLHALEPLARVEPLNGPSPGWLATLREPAASARAGWALLHGRVGGSCTVIPVVLGEDGSSRYPTGLVALRFARAASDDALQRIARKHGLELVRRADLTRQQAFFRPASDADVFLPELSAALARAAGVQAAWLDAESAYRRQR